MKSVLRLPSAHWHYGLLLALLVALASPPAAAVESLQIETLDGQVRVAARDVELRQLLEALAEQAKFKLWISGDLPAQAVTADIAMMPLADALRRLLDENSFALVYDAAGAVSALYLVHTGKAQPIAASLDSDSPDRREQVLRDALANEAIPDHIKAALLSQHSNENEAFRQSVIAQRPEAIRKLIDSLERLGNPSAETLQRLEQTLERDTGQQYE